jgi:hypothetical protein
VGGVEWGGGTGKGGAYVGDLAGFGLGGVWWASDARGGADGACGGGLALGSGGDDGLAVVVLVVSFVGKTQWGALRDEDR